MRGIIPPFPNKPTLSCSV